MWKREILFCKFEICKQSKLFLMILIVFPTCLLLSPFTPTCFDSLWNLLQATAAAAAKRPPATF